MNTNGRFDQLAAPPIFIVGPARSGTTWVHDIYAAHPQVANVLESWLFTRQNGLGALFSPAHRWHDRPSGLARVMAREELLNCVRQMASAVLSKVIEPHHRFFVEKSPSHVFAIPFIVEIFPEAKFVHVLRDGRDVAVSVMAASGTWMPRWRSSFGASVPASAKAWKDAVLRARRDGEQLKERFLEIRYETLQADPFAGYRQLFDFAGIPYNDEILQEVFNKTDFTRNFKENEAGFRRKGKTGDWRNRLRLFRRWQFDLKAGDLLVDLGYAPDRRWWLRRPDGL